MASMAALLSGCSSIFGHSYSDVTCPSADIAGQVGTISRFQGAGGNFANLMYHAEMQNVSGSCDIDENGVTVDVTFTILAESGPMATDSSVDLPYFVAVVDQRDIVISKKIFPNKIEFSPAQHKGGATDTLEQRIPLRNPQAATGYHLMIGFQLSPEELAYNRSAHKTVE